jgi:hypothetical protein
MFVGTESFMLQIPVATNYLIRFTAAQHMNIAPKKVSIPPAYYSHIVCWKNIVFEQVPFVVRMNFV